MLRTNRLSASIMRNFPSGNLKIRHLTRRKMEKKIKILNAYAGKGGNRRRWPSDKIDVVAVENNPDIASMYQAEFPMDKVIVGDAHDYILKHHKEFDFVWSSPPCQSHSGVNFFLNSQGVERYPDMRLYEEIIFLMHFAKCPYCVENVKPYYQPLIRAQIIGRHFLWCNFIVPKIKQPKDSIGKMHGKKQKGHSRPQVENNMVNAELGLHVFNCAIINKQRMVADFHSTETHNNCYAVRDEPSPKVFPRKEKPIA